MKRFKLIAIAIAIILVAVVVLQNTAAVETDILFITIVMPRAVLLSVTFALGLLAGLLIAWRRRHASHESGAADSKAEPAD